MRCHYFDGARASAATFGRQDEYLRSMAQQIADYKYFQRNYEPVVEMLGSL